MMMMMMMMTMWSVIKYLYKILDTSGMTITNSPGEGVASEHADPDVGVGSQALPIPVKDCGSKCGESGGLVGDRQVLDTT